MAGDHFCSCAFGFECSIRRRKPQCMNKLTEHVLSVLVKTPSKPHTLQSPTWAYAQSPSVSFICVSTWLEHFKTEYQVRLLCVDGVHTKLHMTKCFGHNMQFASTKTGNLLNILKGHSLLTHWERHSFFVNHTPAASSRQFPFISRMLHEVNLKRRDTRKLTHDFVSSLFFFVSVIAV